MATERTWRVQMVADPQPVGCFGTLDPKRIHFVQATSKKKAAAAASLIDPTGVPGSIGVRHSVLISWGN